MASDTEWIEEFEMNDQQYCDFYKETVSCVGLFLLYVNKDNVLSHVKKDTVSLSEGVLTKDELIHILRTYMLYDGKKYRPLSIIKYNCDLEPADVPTYLSDTKRFDFLHVEGKIDKISFNDTITLFHSLNSLSVIFHENWNAWRNRTKRVHMRKKKGRRNKTKRILYAL